MLFRSSVDDTPVIYSIKRLFETLVGVALACGVDILLPYRTPPEAPAQETAPSAPAPEQPDPGPASDAPAVESAPAPDGDAGEEKP